MVVVEKVEVEVVEKVDVVVVEERIVVVVLEVIVMVLDAVEVYGKFRRKWKWLMWIYRAMLSWKWMR